LQGPNAMPQHGDFAKRRPYRRINGGRFSSLIGGSILAERILIELENNKTIPSVAPTAKILAESNPVGEVSGRQPTQPTAEVDPRGWRRLAAIGGWLGSRRPVTLVAYL